MAKALRWFRLRVSPVLRQLRVRLEHRSLSREQTSDRLKGAARQVQRNCEDTHKLDRHEYQGGGADRRYNRECCGLCQRCKQQRPELHSPRNAEYHEPVANNRSGWSLGDNHRYKFRFGSGHQHTQVQHYRGDGDKLDRDEYRCRCAHRSDHGKRGRHGVRRGQQWPKLYGGFGSEYHESFADFGRGWNTGHRHREQTSDRQGSSTVNFNGATGAPTSWTATSISVHVPSGATTGNVVVHASSINSNGKSFTVIPSPTITSLSPVSGAPGVPVTITGTNFDRLKGAAQSKSMEPRQRQRVGGNRASRQRCRTGRRAEMLSLLFLERPAMV